MLMNRKHAFRTAWSQLTDVEQRFAQTAVDAVTETLRNTRQPLALAPYCDVPEALADHPLLARPLVVAAITERLTEIARDHTHGTERWLNELSAIAFSNIDDYVVQDEWGNIDIDWNNCTREAKSAVREFHVDQSGKDDDFTVTRKRKVTFKLHDKMAALKMYGEYVGALQPDNPHRIAYMTMLQQNNVTLGSDATPEQVADAYAKMLGE